MTIVFTDHKNCEKTVGDCKIGDIVEVSDGTICVVLSGYKHKSDDFELGSFYDSSSKIRAVIGHIHSNES